MNADIEAEIREIVGAAAKRIEATIREARRSGKYGPFAWATESRRHQLTHARDHIEALLSGTDSGEPDLAHALCRLSIDAALEDREKGGGR